MNKQAQLKVARAKANEAYYGNGRDINAPEYVAAMADVRKLVDAIDAEAAPFEYTSIDGDIFDYREAAQ